MSVSATGYVATTRGKTSLIVVPASEDGHRFVKLCILGGARHDEIWISMKADEAAKLSVDLAAVAQATKDAGG